MVEGALAEVVQMDALAMWGAVIEVLTLEEKAMQAVVTEAVAIEAVPQEAVATEGVVEYMLGKRDAAAAAAVLLEGVEE